MAFKLIVDSNYIVVTDTVTSEEVWFRPASGTVGKLFDGTLTLSFPPMHPFYKQFPEADMIDATDTPFTTQGLIDFLHQNTGS